MTCWAEWGLVSFKWLRENIPHTGSMHAHTRMQTHSQTSVFNLNAHMYKKPHHLQVFYLARRKYLKYFCQWEHPIGNAGKSIQAEISQELQDGLPWNFVPTTQMLNPTCFGERLTTMRFMFVVLAELSQQLLNSFQIFMCSSGGITVCDFLISHIAPLSTSTAYW